MNNLTFTASIGMCDALFAEAIIAVRSRLNRPILVGLSGPQGSGKSTRAVALRARLCTLGIETVVCPLDDFYLTRTDRMTLAQRVHPLFKTRGVPGTHDMPLLAQTLSALISAGDESVTELPRFDKAADDRMEHQSWNLHKGGVDVILLEGWCVGAKPEVKETLLPPVNSLEREEDPHWVWRDYVNSCLSGAYGALFARLDLSLMLRAPSFGLVYRWRAEQEAGLSRVGADARPPMDQAELARFVSHYERITRRLLTDPPADIVADLDQDRAPVACRWIRGDASIRADTPSVSLAS